MATANPNVNEPEAPKAAAPKSKRRWLRFSLRTLLIVMLLLAVSFAWVAKRMREKQLEREAIAEMEEDGKSLVEVNPDVFCKPPPLPVVWLERWLGDGFFEDTRGLSLSGNTDMCMAHIANFPSLRELWVVDSHATEEGLSSLKDLHYLEALRLSYGTFSHASYDNDKEAALDFLDNMPHLIYLQLEGVRPTESGRQRIKCLPKLRRLQFGGHIKESDMAMLGEMHGLDDLELDDYSLDVVVYDTVALSHLSGLKQLKSLTIVAESLTDAGLKHLEGLTALKRLDLPGSSTTDDGVQRLQKALPNCQITH